MLTVSASFYLENPQPRLLEIELMADKASLDDLRGLRTWSTANRLWRLDGAELLAQHGLTWSGLMYSLPSLTAHAAPVSSAASSA